MDHCGLCNRDFTDAEALAQHQRESSIHKKKLRCQKCNSSFGTEQALRQHERDSPAHNETFHCQACNRPFSSSKTLNKHWKSCGAESNQSLGTVVSLLHQVHDESMSSGTTSSDYAVDAQHPLVDQFARLLISENLSATKKRSRQGRKDSIISIQETREFFTFPELHPNVLDAVSPELSSPWFKKPNDHNTSNKNHFTHVMGKFACHNTSCRNRFWGSKKVPIEIMGYKRNGYSATVYNQRCKFCDRLGTFALDESCYIERVAYRLKRWAGIQVEQPPYDEMKGKPHEVAYCEGCKRGKCEKELRINHRY